MGYLLDEAARFRGYTHSEWVSEPWWAKARVVAHYMEHSLRESYAADQVEKSAGNGQAGKPSAPPPEYFRHRQPPPSVV